MKTGRGHLGGSVEHSKRKGGESVVAIPRFLCGSPRLCQLRTEGLVPMSKYWTYRSHANDIGPVSLVASCWQTLGFLHYFIGWLGRKTGYVPVNRSVGVLWIVSGALFLGSSDSVGDSWKVATYGDRPQEVYAGGTWTSVGSVCVMLIRFFPCRVYIDLNHRDSWIWVTACSWLPSSSNFSRLMIIKEIWNWFTIITCLQLLFG
jgi:hypothetical protein